MTTDEIKKAISSKLDRIAEEISKNKDIIIKKTKTGIKIQSIDYKKV